jgi:hypothetical protein
VGDKGAGAAEAMGRANEGLDTKGDGVDMLLLAPHPAF